MHIPSAQKAVRGSVGGVVLLHAEGGLVLVLPGEHLLNLFAFLGFLAIGLHLRLQLFYPLLHLLVFRLQLLTGFTAVRSGNERPGG